MHPAVVWFRARRARFVALTVWLIVVPLSAHAEGQAASRDLGDILLKKGIITPEELQQAREEEKQKQAAGESRLDALKAKLPKWLEMISLFGDIRNRVEGFYGNDYHAQTRYRVRARVGLNANVTDEISGTVRLATGDPNDPISTNQSLTNTFTRKPINLDWAYLTIKPGKTFGLEPGWGQIVTGKFGVNLARYSELVWDDDLSPEGATETLNLWEQREGFYRSFRLNALQWIMNDASANNDSWIAGGQAVTEAAIGSTANLTASFADYNFIDMNRVATTYLSPFTGSASANNCSAAQLAKDPMSTCYAVNTSQNTSLANSNSVLYSAKDSANNRKITGYANGFNVINFGSELDFPNPFGLGIPAGLFGEAAYNTQASSGNTGLAIGLGIGKAQRDWYHDSLKNPGDWSMSYTWERVEKDAVVSLFSFSDFQYQQSKTSQKGTTNVTGSIVRFDYELFSNFQLTVKSMFINALDREHCNDHEWQAAHRQSDADPLATRCAVEILIGDARTRMEAGHEASYVYGRRSAAHRLRACRFEPGT